MLLPPCQLTRVLRPGTQNVPHIVGLGAAAEPAGQRLPGGVARLRARRDERLERTPAEAIIAAWRIPASR